MTDRKRWLIEKLVRAERLVLSALPGSDERLRRSPASGGWSPAEHALHCALVAEELARAFAAARRQPGTPRPRDLVKGLARRLVLTTWRIPRGARAPKEVEPLVILTRRELEDRLRSARDLLADLVDLVDHPAPTPWVEHPRLGAMDFADWVDFVLIHAAHHARLMRS